MRLKAGTQPLNFHSPFAILTIPITSEVFDLKPTSTRPNPFVEFGNGDYPGTFGRARHTRSGVP
jgi:hypothetical protein